MNDPLDPDGGEINPLEPNEPDHQFDVETGDVDTPKPDDPTPTPPKVENPVENLPDADPELKTVFWKLVLLYKFAILGTSIGALLVIFGVEVTSGWALLGGSIGLFIYTLYQTKRGKEKIEAGEIATKKEGEHEAQSSEQNEAEKEREETGDAGGQPASEIAEDSSHSHVAGRNPDTASHGGSDETQEEDTQEGDTRGDKTWEDEKRGEEAQEDET